MVLNISLTFTTNKLSNTRKPPFILENNLLVLIRFLSIFLTIGVIMGSQYLIKHVYQEEPTCILDGLFKKYFKRPFVQVPRVLVEFDHHTILEIIWTLLPAVILVFIALPSLTLLYLLDSFGVNSSADGFFTFKVIGHQ